MTTHAAPKPHGGFLSRLSIEYKLPLISGAVLLVVIVALAAAAYVEVRSTARRSAGDRLRTVTAQLRDMLTLSATQLRAQLGARAAQPALVDYARTRNPRLRARALAALRENGAAARSLVFEALTDASGNILLASGPVPAGLDTASTADVIPRTEPGDSMLVGAMRSVHDTIYYPVATPVPGTDAYLLQWRRSVGSRAARERVERLIGTGASIFVGSMGGGAWTDLERPVDRPPLGAGVAPGVQRYRRGADSAMYLAAAEPVAGTSWMVAVDFPSRLVLSPVSAFMQRIALIAVLALALGLLAAWWMSRSITRPLRDLTQAADAIRVGDFTHQPRIAREDELGRLGAAFSTMAQEVHESRQTLEHRVVERTRDLNDTLSQLHQAQDALVRREKLALLGQLSSGVGHELRNPLGVMTNAVYYLKTVLADAQPNVHEYLDILQQQVTLSEKIVSDLLDFARSKPPQRRATSVADVTHQQIQRLGVTNGVRIDTDLPPTLPSVLVDPVQLGQIVLNLLTNAMQAVDGKGSVVVRASVDADGSHVVYDVQDTGPGIAPDHLDKVFEPLFTTKARGIGLGLAVSRTLARANNGDLTVTSAPGAGATFRLTLDAEQGATA